MPEQGIPAAALLHTSSPLNLKINSSPLSAGTQSNAYVLGTEASLPEHLPRETQTVLPKETKCPECGGELRHLGEDVSEMLEYVPEHFKVIRRVRPKLARGRCDKIVQAEAPSRPIARGMAGPGLLAHVVTSPFGLGGSPCPLPSTTVDSNLVDLRSANAGTCPTVPTGDPDVVDLRDVQQGVDLAVVAANAPRLS